MILEFVGGVIHQIENIKFSKPFNKTFIKKILDGKTNQTEYDNIKMLYSIIEHKKNIQNKIFNKTDLIKQIENIKTEILKNKCYVYCCNEDGKTEGHPAKIPVDKIKKNSFSEEEPQEKSDNSDDENGENLEEKSDNSDDEYDLIYESETEEKKENEVLDFEAEILKMKNYKKAYDAKIKFMKAKQKEKIRNLKIEKMKAQQKPNEKEQLKELINNLNNVDGSYICDMLNLLEKLKPINKQKKERIILNKERNIKALKVDKSKRYVCPFCFGFRMDEKKFFEHINNCKKYDDTDDNKMAVLECIAQKEYKNFKCPTTEQSIQQYNNKYGDELGYIEKY